MSVTGDGLIRAQTDIFLTFSLLSKVNCPWLIMLSSKRSVICSRVVASMSRMTVPLSRKDRSSKREWRERVAT